MTIIKTFFLKAMFCVLLVSSFAHAEDKKLSADGEGIAESKAPLTLKVHRTSESSLFTNLTLIMGEKKAVLVDAPFTRADAHRLVGTILDSGKELETVFITHDHPDHFFTMEVIMQAFPNAKVVAHPTVVKDIWRSLPFKMKRWGPILGNNGPKTPTAPQAMESDTIVLEGHELKVMGPVQGDHKNATYLYIPSLSAVIAGDLIHNEMFLWLGETDRRAVKAWRESISLIEKLKPEIVVAGHSKPGTLNDVSALEYTKKYLDTWLLETKRAKNSFELRARIVDTFPDSIDVLNSFLLGNSSKVAMGEEPIWDE